MTETLQRTIHIDAPVEDVFAVAADIASYPEWTEGLESVEVLDEVDGVPVRAAMVVNAQIKRVSYTLQYEHDAPSRMAWVTEEGGDIRHLQGEYRFSERDGGTEVDYRLELDLGFPLPGFMMRRAASFIMDTALDGLKARVEGA